MFIKTIKTRTGFTLIETLIYIALFSIIMVSGFVTAYQLIQGTDSLNSKTVTEEEVNFVLRKIDWALTGISSITRPSAGILQYTDTLTTIKYGGNQIDICLDANKVKIREGGGASVCSSSEFLPLTSDNVKVTTLQFQYIPPAGTGPAGVAATTTINGIVSTTTKYIRK